MKQKIVLLALFTLLFNSLSSQNWTNYNSTNSGLVNNMVSCIAVDNNDILWVGSTNGCASPYGLNKFDGTTWTNYNQSNSGLVSDAVQRVVSDNNNNVWVSYGNCAMGITKFDGTTWTTYDTTNSNIPSNSVYDLFIDANNDLWLASNGITKFTGTSFINFMSNPSGKNVTELYITDSLVYATSQNLGLYIYNITNSNILHYTTSNSNIPSMNFGSLEMDQNGILWMGCQYGFIGSTGGLATFDGISFTAINPFSSTSTWVYYNQSIAIDQSNNVWVSNRCEGLYKYDGSTWSHVGANLPQNGCAGFVYADHFNSIWYGEVYSGLWTNKSTLGLSGQLSKQDMILYPNPTTDKLTIVIATQSEVMGKQSQIEIFNIQGQIIKTYNATAKQTTLDVSDLSSGIYIIKVKTEQGIVVKKFIKQ